MALEPPDSHIKQQNYSLMNATVLQDARLAAQPDKVVFLTMSSLKASCCSRSNAYLS